MVEKLESILAESDVKDHRVTAALSRIREQDSIKGNRVVELEDQHDDLWAKWCSERDKRRELEWDLEVPRLKRQIHNLKRKKTTAERKTTTSHEAANEDDDEYVDIENEASESEGEYSDHSVDPEEVADYNTPPVTRDGSATGDEESDDNDENVVRVRSQRRIVSIPDDSEDEEDEREAGHVHGSDGPASSGAATAHGEDEAAANADADITEGTPPRAAANGQFIREADHTVVNEDVWQKRIMDLETAFENQCKELTALISEVDLLRGLVPALQDTTLGPINTFDAVGTSVDHQHNPIAAVIRVQNQASLPSSGMSIGNSESPYVPQSNSASQLPPASKRSDSGTKVDNATTPNGSEAEASRVTPTHSLAVSRVVDDSLFRARSASHEAIHKVKTLSPGEIVQAPKQDKGQAGIPRYAGPSEAQATRAASQEVPSISKRRPAEAVTNAQPPTKKLRLVRDAGRFAIMEELSCCIDYYKGGCFRRQHVLKSVFNRIVRDNKEKAQQDKIMDGQNICREHQAGNCCKKAHLAKATIDRKVDEYMSGGKGATVE